MIPCRMVTRVDFGYRLHEVEGVLAVSHRLRWLWQHRLALTATLGLAVVFAYRLVILQPHVALGIDAGNYLATMQQLFGTDVSGDGLGRPPLVGVALWPLAHVFGPLEATKLLAVAASVLIGVPFYLICSRFTGKAVALFVSLPFIFSLKYMDAVSWGCMTLVSVGLLTLCFYLIHEILTASSFDRKRALALGVASAALMGTGQMYGFIYAVTTLAFGGVVLAVGGQFRKGMPRLIPAALLAVLLCLPYILVYLHHSDAVGSGSYVTSAGSLQGLKGGWDFVANFYFASPPLVWEAVGLFALAGAVILIRRNPVQSVLLLTLLLVPLALNMLLAGSVGRRSVYLLYVPVWLGFAVCAEALLRVARGRHRLAAASSVFTLALLASLAALAVWRGHFWLQEAADWYGYLQAEHVKAIEVVDRDAPSGAGIAYPWGLGYWTEGLAGRPVYDVNERERGAFTAAGQRTETLTGNVLLAGDRVTTNGWVFVADAYVVGDVPMDPVLGIDNAYLEHLLYLDDSLIQIEYGAGSAAGRVTLAQALLQESTSGVTGGFYVDRRTYELDGARVVKEVALPEHGNSATVTLTVQSDRGTVNRVAIPVQAALPSTLVLLDPQEALFGFRGLTHFGNGWWAGAYVDVTSTDSEVASLEVGPGDSAVVAEVKPESSQAEVKLTFTFNGEPFGDANGLRSYSAEEVIRERGITFAVLDRNPAKPWFGDPLDVTTVAWLEKAPYLRAVWEGASVAAYVVTPAARDDQGAEKARAGVSYTTFR
jgi:hypothetical protein